MEVTSKNFDAELKDVLQEIKDCSFASTDLEISGLWKRGEPGLLDSQERNYSLFLESASDFTCLQVGLSLFTLHPPFTSYRVKTYVFYVFPCQLNRRSTTSFSCQVNSIQFLKDNDFDFNKVFYEGISFLNIQREMELNQVFEERRQFKEKNQTKERIDIPPEHVDLINQTCEELSKVVDDKECKEKRVPGLNAFLRRLVYQTMKQRFSDGEVLVDTREGCLVSRKGQVDDHVPRSQAEIDEEQVSQAVGFSKVMQALSKSGKLVVGHNMFLDLCHIVKCFLCDLPETYSEFKELVKGLFPLLLDTKYISSSRGFTDLIPGTTLDRLLSRIKETPFSIPSTESIEGYSYPSDFVKYHDAGFDSYVTGIVFIALYNYIAGSKSLKGNVPFDPKSDKLERFINRVFMNNSPDNHHFFGGPDSHPDRSHFFHVKFPKEWVSKDIYELFSPYSRVQLTWIDSTSAWVSLHDKSQAEATRAALCHQNNGELAVTPYSTELFKLVEEQCDLVRTSRKRPRILGEYVTHHHQLLPYLFAVLVVLLLTYLDIDLFSFVSRLCVLPFNH